MSNKTRKVLQKELKAAISLVDSLIKELGTIYQRKRKLQKDLKAQDRTSLGGAGEVVLDAKLDVLDEIFDKV